MENLALKSAEHRYIENDAAKARVLSSILMSCFHFWLTFTFICKLQFWRSLYFPPNS